MLRLLSVGNSFLDGLQPQWKVFNIIATRICWPVDIIKLKKCNHGIQFHHIVKLQPVVASFLAEGFRALTMHSWVEGRVPIVPFVYNSFAWATIIPCCFSESTIFARHYKSLIVSNPVCTEFSIMERRLQLLSLSAVVVVWIVLAMVTLRVLLVFVFLLCCTRIRTNSIGAVLGYSYY